MDKSDFLKAAFDPGHRPALLAELKSDPSLRTIARKWVENIEAAIPSGILDRDHITKMTYETLGRMLGQVDAATASPVSTGTP